jgi:tetratricopeptide (TPR) repeat protein
LIWSHKNYPNKSKFVYGWMIMATDQAMQRALAPLVAAMQKKDYETAIPGLKDYLSTYPGHEIATGLLAAAYFQLGLPQRARELYEQLLARFPTNALARFQLGLLHLSQDPQAALDVWQPLLGREEDFMAHFHAALAHLQLRETDRALPLLEHAGKYMPATHPLWAQLQHLRSTAAQAAADRQA